MGRTYFFVAWRKIVKAVTALALGCIGILVVPEISAQTYPDQPIKIVVPYGPGGTADIIARLVSEKLSKQLKQPVIVDNKAGAAGSIGTSSVARAKPDGSTLLLAFTTEMVINPILQPDVPYAVSDFEPVAFAGSMPLLLVTHPSVPAQTFDELVALGKSKPKSLSYASVGLGSPQHIAGALLEKLAGIDMLHVPYKGGSAAVMDTVSGTVDMYFSGIPPAVPQLKGGRLRALGVAATTPSSALPDVPALAVGKYKELDLAGWFGFFVPRGIPEKIRDELKHSLNEALQSKSVKGSMRDQGVEINAMTSAQFADFVNEENAKYARLINELNIKTGQ